MLITKVCINVNCFVARFETVLSAPWSSRLVQKKFASLQVFDFIFCGGPLPPNSPIPEDKLKAMRQEFEYWYPFDLRVSGKDLIQNHLTFCLYNHTAIWPDEDKWPKSFRANGHIMLNAEKMSKQTGNFLTLEQVCILTRCNYHQIFPALKFWF